MTKKVNFEQFHDLLFPGTGVSIKDSWQRFKDLLFVAADECIPMVTLRKRKKTWLGDETLRMLPQKRHAYKVIMHTR